LDTKTVNKKVYNKYKKGMGKEGVLRTKHAYIPSKIKPE
jgi:hypothetical protein